MHAPSPLKLPKTPTRLPEDPEVLIVIVIAMTMFNDDNLLVVMALHWPAPGLVDTRLS
jgi:hypothetical protein